MTCFDRAQKWLFLVLLIIGGGALAVMMFLVMADIVLRYLFNSPLIGAYEVVEYLMACVVPMGVAYCAFKHEHIVVDIVYDRLPKWTQNCLSMFTGLLSALFCFIMAVQTIVTTVDSYRSTLASAVLHIPRYPFDAWIALGLVVLGLMFILDFISSVRGVTVK